MRFVALSDNGVAAEPGQSAPSNSAMEHCPYCKLGDLPAVVGQAPAFMARLCLQGDHLPALFLHGTRGTHAWSSAQARAPPQHL